VMARIAQATERHATGLSLAHRLEASGEIGETGLP